MIFDENGLELDSCLQEMKEKGDSMNLNDYVKRTILHNLPSSVFVDCTSSADVAGQYEEILSANISIVTPNKKANSGAYENYKKLKSLAQSKGVRFLYETNVGAGLPVINTLNDLLLSGDKVIRIEGVLSGTLNFIFSTFSRGKKFSEVVAEAKAKGYTEPDPRDDLSGMDVARKILILSREAGIQLELEDITIENLVPENCRGDMTPDGFLTKLREKDSHFEKLCTDAESKNEKLRYQAIFENGKASVKLGTVKSDHSFYSLSGSDNIILLTTERYHDRPMVIRGPGAGAEVTAAGVFADIIRIGNYSN
jgi:aspartokinase/homoserine dehydrogenase 1